MDDEWIKRLRMLREAMQLSQRELAARLGVSGTAWQNYETGRNIPGGNVLKGLADLGVSIDWLLTGDGPMLRFGGELPLPDDTPIEPTEALRRKALDSLMADIGLTELAPAATIGQVMTEYYVLVTLAKAHPEPCTLEQVAQELAARGIRLEHREVLGFIAVLMRRGLVKRLDGSPQRFITEHEASLMPARDIPGHLQAGFESMKTIWREAVPRASTQPPRGKILHARFWTTQEKAADMMKTGIQRAWDHCVATSHDQERTEVSVVMAISYSLPEESD